jgi:hypothetical protein
MRQSLRHQSLLRRELRIERSVSEARRLADLRDADAIDPPLPEQARCCLGQRGAVLGRFFLGDFHRPSSVRGFFLSDPEHAAKIAPFVVEAAELLRSGRLHAPVAATYPLSAIKDAVAHVQRGGKVLLDVGAG